MARLSLCLTLALLAACSVTAGNGAPPLSAQPGSGLVFDGGSISLDTSHVPLVSGCTDGQVISFEGSGWSCVSQSAGATGATGPMGPAGPAGETGPAGPAGITSASAPLQLSGGTLSLNGPYIVTATQADGGTSEISLNGVYCGMTAPTTGQISTITNGYTANGYAAAKVLCEAACGKPYAHMCDASEMIRSAQLGISMPGGGPQEAWVSTGTLIEPGSYYLEDCAGWQNGSDTSELGPTFVLSATGASPNWRICNSSYPVACCE